jgi:flagellar protein FlgJ
VSLSPLNDDKSLALDAQALGKLRLAANQNSPEALKASARQFEALFINMMLKNMRQANPAAGLEQGQEAQVYTSMLDQQLSQVMAQRGMGLADMMLRQLSRQNQRSPQAADSVAAPGQTDTSAGAAAAAPVPVPASQQAVQAASGGGEHVQGFRQTMGLHAEEAARMTGLPASFILGQAALESGWGRRQIRGGDGTFSHNLFGIKAGADWKGRVVEVETTEYLSGVPHKVLARFRAYDSYAEAFRDYAGLLLRSPRYRQVLAQGATVEGFAQNLQKAGYASDPAYAEKLSRLIRRNLLT